MVEIARNALQGVAQNIEITVTEDLSRMINTGITANISIILFSVYQFSKLKLMGYETKEYLIRVGKSVSFSLLSLIAQRVGRYSRHRDISRNRCNINVLYVCPLSSYPKSN